MNCAPTRKPAGVREHKRMLTTRVECSRAAGSAAFHRYLVDDIVPVDPLHRSPLTDEHGMGVK